MKRFLIPFLLCATAATAQGPLPEVDVYFLGEVHDNPTHHANQARWVAALKPTALVFEMLDRDEAEIVMKERAAGRIDTLADTLNWDESGWPDWAFYAGVLEAAPDAAIYGAEVPRNAAQRAFGDGAASVFGVSAEFYGLNDALPEDQQSAREEMQFQAHCEAVPRDILPGFVEAQRLRDARLAEAVAEAVDAYGAPVAVITGNGHARLDWGAPSVLSLLRPAATVFAMGQFEEQPDTAQPFSDYVVTEPVERPDPCDAFR